MAKPEWLVEAEDSDRFVKFPTCWDCRRLGPPVKMTRHKNKEWTEVFKCAKHPGCFNTKFSICCDDFLLK